MPRNGNGQASSRPINALHKKPVPIERDTVLERKRAELARVWASLARTGLRPGMAATLKTQEKALLREIDEL
jgi:hypothetical protein